MARRPPARKPADARFDVWLMFALTLIFLACYIVLAVVPTQSASIEKLTESLSTLTNLGAGTLFGLIKGSRYTPR